MKKLCLLSSITIFVIAFLPASLKGQTLISRMLLNKQRYDKLLLKGFGKDSITCYLSVPEGDAKLPLIIFIQGSGRHSLFTKDTVLSYGVRGLRSIAKGKARILLIEKPGVEFLEEDKSGQDPSNNEKFNQKFSLQSWSKEIEDVIKYIVKNESVDTKKIMIMGHSEGGLVAAKVASDLGSLITHVTILAGEGPSQLYSLYSFARSGEFFDDQSRKTASGRIDSLMSTWTDILKYPLATDRLFFGYTYLRWSSFLSTSVLEQLEKFKGKVFITQGTADKNVSPESAIFLYTGLLAKGKDVKIELVEGADHSFYDPKKPNGWAEILTESITWFSI
jgi:predicted esterase